MDLIELNQDGLIILDEWFKDREVLKRLGGTLPLQKWFQYVQKSPNYFAWMAYDQQIPVGQVDIEIYPNYSASISILTNPFLRNKGYGQEILHTLLKKSELSKVQVIKVEIESDNLASIRLFKQVGFVEEGIDNDGLLIYTLNLSDGV